MIECEIKSEEPIRTNEKCDECGIEPAISLIGVGVIQFSQPDAFYRLCDHCKQYALDIYLDEEVDCLKRASDDKANLDYKYAVENA